MGAIMVIDTYTVSYIMALTPLIPIIASLITSLLILFIRKKFTIAFIIAELILFINLVLIFIIFYHILTYNKILVYMFSGFPPPLGIVYEVDLLNAFIGLVIGVVSLIINTVSYKYLVYRGKHSPWYYVFYMMLYSSLMGITYTGDLFNLFVMLCFMIISLYCLRIYLRTRQTKLYSIIRYGLVSTMVLTVCFISLLILYNAFGTLTIADVSAETIGLGRTYFSETYGYAIDTLPAITISSILLISSLLVIAGAIPYRPLLSAIYKNSSLIVVASTATMVGCVSVYVIARLLYTLTSSNILDLINYILITIGSLNIVVGGILIAKTKDPISFIINSIVLDMGYMVISLGLNSVLGLSSTLYYILAYAITKSLLFTSIISIKCFEVKTRSLIAYLGFTVGCLTVIGIPPLNTFFARMLLFQAVLEKKLYPILLIILVGPVLSLIGFKRIWSSFIRESRYVEKGKQGGILIDSIVIALLILTFVTSIFYMHLKVSIIDPLSTFIIDRNYRLDYIRQAYQLFNIVKGG